MARFVFKLQAVLRQRQQIEQQKLRDLAVRQQVVVSLQQDLQTLQTEAQTAMQDLRDNRLVGPINLSYLSAHRRFIMSMGRRAATITQKILQAQKQVDEARLVLAEAAKNRKAIEKLKEKHYEYWRQEQEKKESALLDEVGMQLAFENFSEDDG
jgi:flagellar FliJ protein